MIVIVAIAAVLTLFTIAILPALRRAVLSRLHCTEAYDCDCEGDKCHCWYKALDPDTGEQVGEPREINCRVKTDTIQAN